MWIKYILRIMLWVFGVGSTSHLLRIAYAIAPSIKVILFGISMFVVLTWFIYDIMVGIQRYMDNL